MDEIEEINKKWRTLQDEQKNLQEAAKKRIEDEYNIRIQTALNISKSEGNCHP